MMSRIREIFTRYPLLRGMVSYSILWPTSALIQQKIAGKSWSEIDWAKCARFSFYGGLYVAPTLYTWIRVSSKLFPQANLRSAVCKVKIFFSIWISKAKMKHATEKYLKLLFCLTIKGFIGTSFIYTSCNDKFLLFNESAWGTNHWTGYQWGENKILANIQGKKDRKSIENSALYYMTAILIEGVKRIRKKNIWDLA